MEKPRTSIVKNDFKKVRSSKNNLESLEYFNDSLSLFDETASTPCCSKRGLSGACFSEDRRFRYALWRRWNQGRTIAFLLLNPSIANEEQLDNTLRRCQGTAKDLGYAGFEVANVFPLVSTDRSQVIKTPDRDGEIGRNHEHISEMLGRCGALVLGFGHEVTRPPLRYVIKDLRKLFERLGKEGMPSPQALRITEQHLPQHPLYLPKGLVPQPYTDWPEWTK